MGPSSPSSPSQCPPSSDNHGTASSQGASGPLCGGQSILRARPQPSPRPLSPSFQLPAGSQLSPPGWSPPEGDPRLELVALRARTRLWFKQKEVGGRGQAPSLVPRLHQSEVSMAGGAEAGDRVVPSASPPLGSEIGSWTPGSHKRGDGERLRAPSRKETEQRLQDEPLGCFLVHFSESTIGFVLSYR